MIPLAQLLSEFEDDATEAFEPLTVSRQPGRGDLRFEHLTLVKGASDVAEAPKIAAVIPEIGRPPEAAPAAPAVDHRRELEEAVAAAREAALAEGRKVMRAELEAGYAEALAAERAKAQAEMEAALAAARAEWADGEGRRLASLLDGALCEIEATVRATFGGVLKPLARDARRQQTLNELADAVAILAGDGRAFAIRATGPADLLQALREHLGTRADRLAYEVDEARAELRVEADRTVIETRLAGWRTALEEALA